MGVHFYFLNAFIVWINQITYEIRHICKYQGSNWNTIESFYFFHNIYFGSIQKLFNSNFMIYVPLIVSKNLIHQIYHLIFKTFSDYRKTIVINNCFFQNLVKNKNIVHILSLENSVFKKCFILESDVIWIQNLRNILQILN